MDADDAGITGPSGSMFPELFQNWREESAGGFLCVLLYTLYMTSCCQFYVSAFCVLTDRLFFPVLIYISDVKPANLHPPLVLFFGVIPLYLRRCSGLGL